MASVAPGLGPQPPAIVLPEPDSVFSHRARRFRLLAQNAPSLAGFLSLMADLAEGQHRLSRDAAALPVPAALGEVVPLETGGWQPGPVWHDTLRRLLEHIDPADAVLASLVAALRAAPTEPLEAWARGLLAGHLDQFDAAVAPFVAAALQWHWVGAASVLDASRIAAGSGHRCPVCDFLPVAALLQTGGALHGLRYLVCGLCASQWHRPRIQCVHCGSSRDVAYHGIDGAGAAVRAETCDGCRTYVKVLNRERDTGLDAFADDIASLPLDLLLAEAGYQRLGFNPLLIPGR